MDANQTVLCFGEIMMRLSPPNNLRLEQTSSFDVRYGGAEANAALSLSYQGDNAAYVSVVPDNRIGDCALRSLTTYGVDTSRVIREGDRLGSYFFEVGASVRGNSCVYDRKYSAIQQANHTDFDWEKILDNVGVFYFSGVTPAISAEMLTACEEALTVARQRGITTVCDVNYRGKMWSPEASQKAMAKLLPMVDVVIANDEDAPSGLGVTCVSGSLEHGIDERDGYAQMARELCSTYGCNTVASVIRDVRSVEDSDWMGMVYDAATDQAVYSTVHHMHVLEGVAAGDAFNAGLIHGMLHGYELSQLVDYAIAASVLKLTIHGDSNLVTESEIAAVASSGGGTRVAR